MSAAENKAVFLSYASQDAEAAKRICDALRAAGVEVWFDQRELRGGDSWDAKIRQQIKECALFVPIITPNTNSRPEGYFRLEWKLAVDRSHLLADDHPFLFPVVIGDVVDATARVPDKFRDVQWTRLRLDETPGELAKRVTRLLSDGGPEDRVQRTEDRHIGHRHRPAWLRYAWAGVGVVFALVYAIRPLFQTARRPELKPAVTVPATPAAPMPQVSEARQLALRARALIDILDSTPDDYATAEGLLKRALELDANDGEVLAVSSLLNSLYLSRGFDRADARREAARSQAERAVKLAPESPDAWLALGRGTFLTDFARSEQALRRGLELAPRDGRLLIALGGLYRRQSRFDESLAMYEQAATLPDSRALARYDQFLINFYLGRFAEADRCIRDGLAEAKTVNIVSGIALLEVTWRGRVAEARQVLADAPANLRTQPRMVVATVLVSLMGRLPEDALHALDLLPADYINDAWFTGPKALLAGLAHAQAGRPEAARIAWETGLAVVRRRLQDTPNDVEQHMRLGELLAWSGQTDAALREAKIVDELMRGEAGAWTFSSARIYAALGWADEAVPLLKRLLLTPASGRWPLSPALLRLDPLWDKLRGDPRFQKLCEEPADQAAAPAAKVDDKSVAVLPFENMSADKDNAYFCNGIQEDILTSLANLHELRVVSRTSVEQYRGTTKTIRQIAAELNVAYVLEGSVQRSGNKVRVTGQLIRAGADEHVWAEKFDRDLTDVFGLQSELAQAIAGQLQAAISPREKAVLERRPTENVAAYDLYLKARTLRRHESWGAKLTELVTALLHQAVELDPRFAAAWAELGDTYAQADFNDQDKTPATREKARAAIDRARELAPDDPVVLGLMGDYYFHANHDYAHATEQYLRLAEIRPNDPQIAYSLGRIQRRQGRWVDALANLRRANALDPASPEVIAELFALLMDGRRFPEAEALMRQQVKNAPEVFEAGFGLAVAAYFARGSVAEMNEFARKDFGPAKASAVISRRKLLARLRGDWAEAVRLDRQLPVDDNYWSSWAQDIAASVTLAHTGDRAGARARAAATLPAMLAVMQSQPDNSWLHGWLALAYAMTGDKAHAVAHAERSVAILPESQDAVFGAENSLLAAAALAWVGEKDRALGEFARCLRIPHGAKVVAARNGFTGPDTQCSWQPLQDDPRFQALLNDSKNNEPLF